MNPPISDPQYPNDESDAQEPIALTAEPEDDRRERDESIIAWFERVFHILNAYQANQSDARQLRMSLRTMELALGFTVAAGAQGPAELAKKLGISKQTVGKALNHFNAQLKLSPLPFQRRQDARANMSAARKAQVQSKNP